MGLRTLAGATPICAVEKLDLLIGNAMSGRPPRKLRGRLAGEIRNGRARCRGPANRAACPTTKA